ncbi:molybdenum ABC transporter ATPase [Peptococcaceae bacterium SCADC1_2_3]|jgi:molybdate transport system ATP-binding protein|nr:molybdenum ABC transporter ATPase [Peptococcaceae bacterium SCADC1_2_3]KFI35746.1 molybdenum ABC transporter ATPase [Peptococcaceae bacterium SCADC1_2_3]KFI37921.1 molybdenum ABC transporter ATPase [Peptococcaceae bacterium SCADC1_2_3]
MLKAEGICKRYGNQIVLQQANIELDSEIKALIGINGGGKSTFLKIIAGIVREDQGKVYINGRQVNNLPPEQRKIGYVPQYPALFQHLSAEENVLYGARKNREASQDFYEQVTSILGLTEVLRKRPHELSGGYKSRVSLARALLPQPHILLMDEPLSGMDIIIRKKVLPVFRQVLKKIQIPVLYVTHDPEEAELMADSYAAMNYGEIRLVVSAAEAFEAIQNRHGPL